MVVSFSVNTWRCLLVAWPPAFCFVTLAEHCCIFPFFRYVDDYFLLERPRVVDANRCFVCMVREVLGATAVAERKIGLVCHWDLSGFLYKMLRMESLFGF